MKFTKMSALGIRRSNFVPSSRGSSDQSRHPLDHKKPVELVKPSEPQIDGVVQSGGKQPPDIIRKTAVGGDEFDRSSPNDYPIKKFDIDQKEEFQTEKTQNSNHGTSSMGGKSSSDVIDHSQNNEIFSMDGKSSSNSINHSQNQSSIDSWDYLEKDMSLMPGQIMLQDESLQLLEADQSINQPEYTSPEAPFDIVESGILESMIAFSVGSAINRQLMFNYKYDLLDRNDIILGIMCNYLMFVVAPQSLAANWTMLTFSALIQYLVANQKTSSS